MRTPVVPSNNLSYFFAVRRTKVWRTALSLIVIAGAVWLGFHWRGDESRADKSVMSAGGALPDLRGAAATQYLREQGLYDSLQEAVKVVPYQVRRVRQSGQAGQVGRIEPKPLPGGPAAYEGRNPAQQFNAYFTSEGLHLRSGAAALETWQMALTLRRIGYGGRAIEVGAGEVKAVNNRVEIRRESQIMDLKSQITEWYVNDPGGLEHGFTLAAPPPVERDGERLRLVMTLGGDLQARAADDGQSVALRNRSGEHALHYSGLVVTDATGRELEARLTAAANELAIEVDDAACAYPVVIDPTFVQQQRLTANDGAVSDLFGVSVALSGDTALIGAIGNGVAGAAYVFVRSGSAWTFQQKLTPADGAAGNDFGRSVALSGNTALVGAYRDDIGVAADRGSAYVFLRSGTAWSEQQKLTASDGAADDNFGFAVALSGDTALVGAPSDDVGLDTNQGSAYVFTRSGMFWSQQQKLTDSNGGPSDQFGQSVALSGETALIGSHLTDLIPGESGDQGSAHIFLRSGATWTRIQKLLAGNGAPGDEFGYSVAISGDTAVVGAPSRRIGADVNQGTAYIFDNCPGAITINPMALPAGQIGAPYNQNLTASGGFAPYTFSVIAGSLPANMTLSAAGVLSGAPTQSGVFNFTVQATDQNGCSGSRVYALTINSCPPIAVNPSALPAGTVGAAYNQALSVSGGAPRSTLSVTAGPLPTGLSLTAGGVLLGVPRQTGIFNLTIKATDANGCMGARAYTLTINCATITVNPATPPNGTVGSPYNMTITASGGGAPHTFAVTAGALPNGLMLSTDGTLSGSPTAAGAFNFTVQATDSNRCKGARAYSMTISDGTISGLQYYLLPAPIRLLDTRPGSGACDAPGAPLGGRTTRIQPARTRCSGVPANALAITGNATVVNFISDGGHITLFPSNAAQPLASNLNFTANHIVSNSFTVGLGGDGAFNIFTSASTDFIVDLTGYFSDQAVDVNGQGLLFYPLSAPVRLLDTRPDPFASCVTSSEPFAAGSTFTLQAQLSCEGQAVPAGARSAIGAATVVNFISGGGYITLFSSDAAQPVTSNLNFTANHVVSNSFVAGLGNDGAFRIFTSASTDFIVDLSGYFAP